MKLYYFYLKVSRISLILLQVDIFMKKNRLRGKLKGYFFALKLHRLMPSGISVFLSQLSRLSLWVSNQKNVPYSDFYSARFNYAKRYDLYSYIIESESINGPVDYLEFGVAGGLSFRWWSEYLKDPGSRLFGFDTFTGLPEDWGDFKKGDMSNQNAPPDIGDSRCSFYQGLFQQTLPEFLKSYSPGRRKIIHMDADLYTSTLFVLTSISPYLRRNDLIIFDEFNVPMHEFKAFSEWTKSFYIKYSVIGAVNNFYQVAVKIG
jgi:O-methyltransferase